MSAKGLTTCLYCSRSWARALRFFRFLSFCFATINFSGCGDRSDSSLSSIEVPQDPGTPVVVVMGGYLSCRFPLNTPYSISMYPQARAFINFLTTTFGKQARFVITCFHTSPSEMRYFTSDNSRQMGIAHPDNLNQIILNQTQKAGVHSLYLIGHSYGGWNVMRASHTLPAQTNIRMLATIDPISMRNCHPEVFAMAYLRSMLRFNPAEGCTQAPSDLRPHFANIARRVHRWQHVYQNDFGYLHSSAVYEARSSRKLEMDINWLNAFQAHLEIDSDNRTWTPILNSAIADFSNTKQVTKTTQQQQVSTEI